MAQSFIRIKGLLAVFSIVTTLCGHFANGRGNLVCFEPPQELHFNRDSKDGRNMICKLASDEQIFNNIVHFSSRCVVIRKEQKPNEESVCMIFRSPPITFKDLQFSATCVCLSTLCFIESYWSPTRTIVARWTNILPPSPTEVPTTTPSTLSPSTPTPTPTPSPSPPPPVRDLMCWSCKGRATCTERPNLDVACLIPDTSTCELIAVNSDTTECVIKLEVQLDNVSTDAVTFEAGTIERIDDTINRDFQPILNDTVKASFIGRSRSNRSNSYLTVPSVYWKGLTRRNQPIKCYMGCGGMLECNFTTDPFCQIPQEFLMNNCTMVEVTSKFQSCSLGITVTSDGDAFFAVDVVSGSVEDPRECVETMPAVTSSFTTYDCRCRGSFCNGIIQLK